MTITSKSKVAAMVAGLAIAASMLSVAPIASAASLTSAQVSSILSLLSSFGAGADTIANVNSALTGSSSTSGSTVTTTGGTSACSFSSNLTIGSTGMAVSCLQNALIAGGFSIPAGATGYFGTQTRSAVASWQSSRNIAPAVGYFGPISRAAFDLGGSTTSTNTTTTTTTTTSTVAGCTAGAAFSSTTGATCVTVNTSLTGSGRLSNISSLGDVTNDLKAGDSATNVIGVSAVATGGDVAIQRVEATFTIASTGSQSSNLNMYVGDVSLYLDGTKIGSVDPTTADKSGRVWTVRFSGLNGVIKSGATGNLYIKVTPLSTVGTNEDSVTTAHNVTVALTTTSIRAVAADGISDTYGAAVSQIFKVSSQTTGALTVTLGTDNPAAAIVTTSSTTTSGVKVLSFNMKAKNNAVTITDLGASLGVSSGNTVSGVVSQVKLMGPNGYSKTGTINAGTGTYSTVTFSDVNRTIAADVTEAYWISVDLKNDSGYADSSTIIASTTASDLWDVSDAKGATVTPSAAVLGNTQTLIGTGIVVAALVGTPTATYQQRSSATGAVDHVATSISFTLTADGNSDIYVPSYLATGSTTVLSTTKGIAWATTTDSTTGTTTSATISATGDATSDVSAVNAGYFKIPAGTTRTFTLSTSIADGLGALQTGAAGARIIGFNYGTSATSMTSIYSFNLGSFKTPTIPGLGAN